MFDGSEAGSEALTARAADILGEKEQGVDVSQDKGGTGNTQPTSGAGRGKEYVGGIRWPDG